MNDAGYSWHNVSYPCRVLVSILMRQMVQTHIGLFIDLGSELTRIKPRQEEA